MLMYVMLCSKLEKRETDVRYVALRYITLNMLFVFFYEYEYVTEVDFVCRNQTLLNENHYKNDRKSNVVYVAMLRIFYTPFNINKFSIVFQLRSRALAPSITLSLSHALRSTSCTLCYAAMLCLSQHDRTERRKSVEHRPRIRSDASHCLTAHTFPTRWRTTYKAQRNPSARSYPCSEECSFFNVKNID